MTDSSDRRKFKRLPKHSSLIVQRLSYEEMPSQEISEYKDLGGGGILLESRSRYEVGTLLKIQAQVPGWGAFIRNFKAPEDNETRNLVAVGEVVRLVEVRKGVFEIGIKFVNVFENDHRALMDFIDNMTDDLE